MSRNYTSKTEKHVDYVKRIRTSTNTPKKRSAQPPLTIVEFRLFDTVRDSLKKALSNRRRYDDETLGNIIKAHIPESIINELREFAQTKGSMTVYVIHNLPELDKDDVQKQYTATLEEWKKRGPNENSKGCRKLIRNSYTDYIQRGLANAAELQIVEEEAGQYTPRWSHTGRYGVLNIDFHKDKEPVTSLGCVINDGVPTRFINDNIRKAILEAGKKIKKKDCQDVIIGGGSIAFWANDGVLQHTAVVPKENVKLPKGITQLARFITLNPFTRPSGVAL